ncbi:MAG: alpha hydrolase [Methanomicrobiaceae archaeon]|nr:alpha hydrolase [Methanomicrobiaceae archaeon]
MKAGILFSGGKDSALAAVMLSRDYEVELNTFVFRPERDIAAVQNAAQVLGLPHVTRVLGDAFLQEACDLVVGCGYPNDAINLVHRHALSSLAALYPVVGDGTRLNDRVPMLSAAEVQSIEARLGCSYVRPLLGFGTTEVKRLAERHLVVRFGETGEIENGDYEHEIRGALRERGCDPAPLFPAHHRQSLVVGVVCG